MYLYASTYFYCTEYSSTNLWDFWSDSHSVRTQHGTLDAAKIVGPSPLEKTCSFAWIDEIDWERWMRRNLQEWEDPQQVVRFFPAYA